MLPTVVLVLTGSAAAPGVCAAQDAIALARAGTAALENHRFGEALEAFTRAAAVEPRDASLCFGAGVAAFMLGQDPQAQTRFECALALNPAYLPAAMWLGDLHYRAGRLEEAISIYETAQRRSPEDRGLHEQLAAWRREQELQRRFHELRTDHFTALFEAAADEPLAREVVERLETAYWRVGDALGVYPSKRLTVVLYTREQFADITRLPRWSVAAYDGRIRVPLAAALTERAELDRVLSHEYVHAVVAVTGGRTVPAWLNEGLASVLEPADSTDRGAAMARPATRTELAALHRSFVGLSRNEAENAYESATRAVRRLIDQSGAAAVVALLRDLAHGTAFGSAFHDRFAMSYEQFATVAARH